PTSISTLSLHDALPIYQVGQHADDGIDIGRGPDELLVRERLVVRSLDDLVTAIGQRVEPPGRQPPGDQDSGTGATWHGVTVTPRSEEHTSELQSRSDLV